ncbi:hydroxymethylbilane synthase, partial [Spirillospora sp. NPDC049652]
MTETDRRLRLGTRRSLMATTQSGLVADALTQATGHGVELVGVTTEGDVSKALLAQIGGTGVFVNALRDRLLSGEVDFAVHSLKDLPTGPAEGIALAAVPRRDDPRDALCGAHKLADLPAGARVGTGSPRRVAQLRALRPDLDIRPIRGNADTRLRKVADGELDAVVLAHAGLKRIGRLDDVAEVFEPDAMLPAPGQGALALECRADDPELVALLAAVDDPGTRAAVTAERTVLAVLEGGCSAPVGAYAAVSDGALHVTAAVVAHDGTSQVR